MFFFKIKFIAVVLIMALSGCQQNTQPQRISSELIKKLSDQDILAISEQACTEMDKQAVLPVGEHALTKRLRRIAETLPTNINGIEINYKVYLNTEPNAWSTANGCIRVNSRLIKLLTDNELQAVLAHEQGHIALKHAITTFRQAPYIEISHKASDTVLMVKQEVAQQYEIDADNYAFELLIKENIDPSGIINMLIKMPIHSSQQPILHPSNQNRIDNILIKLNKK